MKKTLSILILLLSISNFAFTPSPWTTKSSYTERATQKLGYGVKNFLLGWTELFIEPGHANDAQSFVEGLGLGIFNAIVYTVGGGLHALTFPFTFIDIALPGKGVQL